jgi:hypothetical protein
MPQLHTKLSERMANKRRVKPGKFMMAFDDLTKMVDVLFIGLDGEHLGEVQVAASPAGRRAVEKLFPEYVIHWFDTFGSARPFFPEDWKTVTLELPCLLKEMAGMGLQHNLPKDLLGRRPINELCPDQFAALMTAGADDQGVRSAMWSLSENKIEIIGDPRRMGFSACGAPVAVKTSAQKKQSQR